MSPEFQIVDFYHAREHYWNVVKACFGQNRDIHHQWLEDRCKELDDGNVEGVNEAIKILLRLQRQDKEFCGREIGFFEKNRDRMRHADFRKLGLFIGYGVLEAGCRTVIEQRLKQSGMHWTVTGANRIIALRCGILSTKAIGGKISGRVWSAHDH